jgi:hypothetical protein
VVYLVSGDGGHPNVIVVGLAQAMPRPWRLAVLLRGR